MKSAVATSLKTKIRAGKDAESKPLDGREINESISSWWIGDQDAPEVKYSASDAVAGESSLREPYLLCNKVYKEVLSKIHQRQREFTLEHSQRRTRSRTRTGSARVTHLDLSDRRPR